DTTFKLFYLPVSTFSVAASVSYEFVEKTEQVMEFCRQRYGGGITPGRNLSNTIVTLSGNFKGICIFEDILNSEYVHRGQVCQFQTGFT
ncbi:MAG: hypothetical protein MJY77_05005, partial [Bacteroidaceae bacterium]|nr:hypothetical protein [Bacteroidaceae bacterium]